MLLIKEQQAVRLLVSVFFSVLISLIGLCFCQDYRVLTFSDSLLACFPRLFVRANREVGLTKRPITFVAGR